jgi:hypothetical protein
MNIDHCHIVQIQGMVAKVSNHSSFYVYWNKPKQILEYWAKSLEQIQQLSGIVFPNHELVATVGRERTINWEVVNIANFEDFFRTEEDIDTFQIAPGIAKKLRLA